MTNENLDDKNMRVTTIELSIRTPDYIDEQLLKIVNDKQGIRLADLARAIDLPYNTVRYRITDFEVKRLVSTELVRGRLMIYPAVKNDDGKP
jgi:predicted transcriptional regulator